MKNIRTVSTSEVERAIHVNFRAECLLKECNKVQSGQEKFGIEHDISRFMYFNRLHMLDLIQKQESQLLYKIPHNNNK